MSTPTHNATLESKIQVLIDEFASLNSKTDAIQKQINLKLGDNPEEATSIETASIDGTLGPACVKENTMVNLNPDQNCRQLSKSVNMDQVRPTNLNITGINQLKIDIEAGKREFTKEQQDHLIKTAALSTSNQIKESLLQEMEFIQENTSPIIANAVGPGYDKPIFETIPNTDTFPQSERFEIRKDRFFDAVSVMTNDTDVDEEFITINMIDKAMLKLYLPDKTVLLTLCDTGSSVNLLSEDIIAKSTYLKNLTRHPALRHLSINTSSNVKITPTEFVRIEIHGSGLIFYTHAYIVPTFGIIDFILSYDTMGSIGMDLDIQKHRVKIQKKTFILKNCRHIKIQPGVTKRINVFTNMPALLQHKNFIAKPFKSFSKYLPSEFLLAFTKKRSTIQIKNTGNKPLILTSTMPLATIDSRATQPIITTRCHMHINEHHDRLFCYKTDCEARNDLSGQIDISCDKFNTSDASHRLSEHFASLARKNTHNETLLNTETEIQYSNSCSYSLDNKKTFTYAHYSAGCLIKSDVNPNDSPDSMKSLDSHDSVKPCFSNDSVTTLASPDSVYSHAPHDSVMSLDTHDSVRPCDSHDSVKARASQDLVKPLDSRKSVQSGDSHDSEMSHYRTLCGHMTLCDSIDKHASHNSHDSVWKHDPSDTMWSHGTPDSVKSHDSHDSVWKHDPCDTMWSHGTPDFVTSHDTHASKWERDLHDPVLSFDSHDSARSLDLHEAMWTHDSHLPQSHATFTDFVRSHLSGNSRQSVKSHDTVQSHNTMKPHDTVQPPVLQNSATKTKTTSPSIPNPGSLSDFNYGIDPDVYVKYRDQDQESMSKKDLFKLKSAVFPHLDKTDKRLTMTDREIIKRELDLKTDSVLSPDERSKVFDMFYKNRACLSTHGQVGTNTNLSIKLLPQNLSPFSIKPYLKHERDILFAEAELKKFEQLGILQKGYSEFLSPVMLISKAHTGEVLDHSQPVRLLADFRHLNKHLQNIKFSYPEVKYILQKVGKTKPTVFSLLDLKHAFYSILLHPDSRKYTTICAAPGSISYRFLRLPQGVKSSPCAFTNIMNTLINELPDKYRDHVTAIMDDVLLTSQSVAEHMELLEVVLQKLASYGFLLGLNKVLTFRSMVTYMGLSLSSEDNRPVIRATGSRIKSMTILPIPQTIRGIKSFVGQAVFISQFLPRLSDLIGPLNKLTRKVNKNLPKTPPIKPYNGGKGRTKAKSPNITGLWTQEHTDCFHKLIKAFSTAPCLTLPDNKGKFEIEIDSSKLNTAAVLYQWQDNKNRIIAYFSHSKPETAQRWSSTELEICGLAEAVLHFQYLLKYNKFNVIMDNSAIRHIYCSKKMPATLRIQKALERITDFDFDISYRSGSKMYISDFLSRYANADRSKPEPISYYPQESIDSVCLTCSTTPNIISCNCTQPSITPKLFCTMGTYDDTFPPLNDTVPFSMPTQAVTTPSTGPAHGTRSQCRKFNIQVPELFQPTVKKLKSKKQKKSGKITLKPKITNTLPQVPDPIQKSTPPADFIMDQPIPNYDDQILHPLVRKGPVSTPKPQRPKRSPRKSLPSPIRQAFEQTKTPLLKTAKTGKLPPILKPTKNISDNSRQPSKRSRKPPVRFQSPPPVVKSIKTPVITHEPPTNEAPGDIIDPPLPDFRRRPRRQDTADDGDETEPIQPTKAQQKGIKKSFLEKITAQNKPVINKGIISQRSGDVIDASIKPFSLGENLPEIDMNAPPEIHEHLNAPNITRDFPTNKHLLTKPLDKDSIKYMTHLPKQKDLDKFLDQLNFKCLNLYQLPFDMIQLATAQLNDPYFKPFIQYLKHDSLPTNKRLRKNIMSQSENYILFNNVLFRTTSSTKVHDKLALCIPEKFAYQLFEKYHNNMLSSHLGILKTFYKIRENFYLRNLYIELYRYIMSCRLCAARRDMSINDKSTTYVERLIEDFSPFHTISMDISVLPPCEDYRYLLVMRCQITRYVITQHLVTRDAICVAEALFQNIFLKFGPPKVIIADLDSAFKNSLIDAMTKAMGIKIIFVSKDNHKSNQAERSIKDLTRLLLYYISKYSNQWIHFHAAAAYCINTFRIIGIGYSPFELLYNRTNPNLTNYNMSISIPASYDYNTFMLLMNHRYAAMSKIVLDRHNNLVHKRSLDQSRSAPHIKQFEAGDCVFLYSPDHTILPPQKSMSKKLSMRYLGPMFVYESVGEHQYVLMTSQHEVITQLYHLCRLKSGSIRCANGKTVTNYRDFLKENKSQEETELESKNSTIQPIKRSNLTFIEDNDLTSKITKTQAHSHFSVYDSSPIFYTYSNREEPLSSLKEAQIFTTPAEITKMRYKGGHLQIIVKSFDFPSYQWIQVNDPLLYSNVLSIAEAGNIRICGTITKFSNKIFNMKMELRQLDSDNIKTNMSTDLINLDINDPGGYTHKA